MKIKTAMIATVLMAIPALAGAMDMGKDPAKDTAADASQAMPGGMGMQGHPMMGEGPCRGMMGRGMGPDNMDMMDRQQMMERRMDMMEMMMQRRQGMQGSPMMGGPRGGMGQGMGMQDGAMMNDRMSNMRNMSPEQQKQVMQQRMGMMKARMGMMQQKMDMMQKQMDMMDKQTMQRGGAK